MFDRKQYKKDLRKINQRPPRVHREKNECGKVPYDTREEVLTVASLRLRVGTEAMLRPYLHRDCGKWHLTSKEYLPWQ